MARLTQSDRAPSTPRLPRTNLQLRGRSYSFPRAGNRARVARGSRSVYPPRIRALAMKRAYNRLPYDHKVRALLTCGGPCGLIGTMVLRMTYRCGRTGVWYYVCTTPGCKYLYYPDQPEVDVALRREIDAAWLEHRLNNGTTPPRRQRVEPSVQRVETFVQNMFPDLDDFAESSPSASTVRGAGNRVRGPSAEPGPSSRPIEALPIDIDRCANDAAIARSLQQSYDQEGGARKKRRGNEDSLPQVAPEPRQDVPGRSNPRTLVEVAQDIIAAAQGLYVLEGDTSSPATQGLSNAVHSSETAVASAAKSPQSTLPPSSLASTSGSSSASSARSAWSLAASGYAASQDTPSSRAAEESSSTVVTPTPAPRKKASIKPFPMSLTPPRPILSATATARTARSAGSTIASPPMPTAFARRPTTSLSRTNSDPVPRRSPSIISISSDDEDAAPPTSTQPRTSGTQSTAERQAAAAARAPSIISLSSDSDNGSRSPAPQQPVVVMPDSGVVLIPDSDDSGDEMTMTQATSHRQPTPDRAHKPSPPPTQPKPSLPPGESDEDSSASNKENIDASGHDVSLFGGVSPRRTVSFMELGAPEPSDDEDATSDTIDLFAEGVEDDENYVPMTQDRYFDYANEGSVDSRKSPDDDRREPEYLLRPLYTHSDEPNASPPALSWWLHVYIKYASDSPPMSHFVEMFEPCAFKDVAQLPRVADIIREFGTTTFELFERNKIVWRRLSLYDPIYVSSAMYHTLLIRLPGCENIPDFPFLVSQLYGPCTTSTRIAYSPLRSIKGKERADD